MPNKILLKDFLAQLKDKTITNEITGDRALIVDTHYIITETRLDRFDLKISLAIRVYDHNTNRLGDAHYTLSITKRDLQYDKDLDNEIEAISEPLKHEIMSGIRVKAGEIAKIAQQ